MYTATCCALLAPVSRASPPSKQDYGHKPTPELSRRQLVGLLVPLMAPALPANSNAAPARGPSGDWSSPGLAVPEDESAPKFFKTPSGVKVQQLAEGAGQTVNRGDRVLVDYVLRRANGYFIYSTVEGVSFQPRDVPIGPIPVTLDASNAVPGLVDGMEGMRVGGKRRILVPAVLGYEESDTREPKMPTFATQRQLTNHRSEPLLFEVQVLRVIK